MDSKKVMKPDWVLTIPENEYHAATRRGDFLSSHMLGDFRANPRLYQGKMSGEIAQPETEAMLFGRMVHKLVLEGRGEFDREYIVDDGPKNPKTGECYGKTTKAYQEWARAMVLPVCSTKDFNFISKLQASVWLHNVAMELLDSGFAEGVARATWCGEPCQIRMDWYDPVRGLLDDLKTCDTLDYFERDAVKFGYIHQMAFYRDVADQAKADSLGITVEELRDREDWAVNDVYLTAVEKREPFRVGVWKIAESALDKASEQNRKAVALLQECRCMNQWPTGYEDVRELDFFRKGE